MFLYAHNLIQTHSPADHFMFSLTQEQGSHPVADRQTDGARPPATNIV